MLSKQVMYSYYQETLETVHRQEPELLQVAVWLQGRKIFLQDADSFVVPPEQLAEVLVSLRNNFHGGANYHLWPGQIC